MANYKFFNIGKANEEITRLEAEVSRITAEHTATVENCTAITGQAEQLTADLTTARQSISTLTQSNTTLTESVIKISAERDELKNKLANPSEQVKTEAAKVAQTIVATQGIPAPVETKTTAANPADQKKNVTELKGRERYNASIKIEGQPNSGTQTA